jgi:hypothetical protein
MKKTSALKKSSPFHPCRVITLTHEQLTEYLTGKIDICGPDGEVLTGIGKLIDDKAQEFQREMAADNFGLLENLIRSCGSNPLEISERGALGLANAFWQAQEMINQ